MSSNTLREEIATQLRERILTGAMDRGMRLDLDLLAADFSASRTPVREALLLLAREGLVEFNPRQSSVVIGVTAADIRDIYFVFGALQGLAAAAAARTREPTLLERLGTLIDHAVGPSAADPVETDIRNAIFHRTINDECGSRVLKNQLRQLSALIPRRSFALFPDRCVSSAAEHRELLQAIVDGNAALARSLTEEHFVHAGELMHSWMENGGRLASPYQSSPANGKGGAE